jgi:hypothetical protein
MSFRPGQKRFGIEEIADCLADLMTETLGYRRFAAQGHDVRAGGLDPCASRHIRSQDARAAARTLPARHHGQLAAALWRHASEAHRHWHPHPDRATRVHDTQRCLSR